jgi:MFS family permease
MAAQSPGFDRATLAAIPRGVWALGFVSMLMDVSSEMIHSLLPLYLVAVLGTSAVAVGWIEGIAEATASIMKVFSGALSDWLGRRKLLAAIGYGLAALTKPVFPLATSIGWIAAARFADRVGKGIRGAPRDALVADLAPPHLRGASFGLRQSLDTVGAFVGPLAAIGLMAASAGNFRLVFWIAAIPAFLSFFLIVFAVPEPARKADAPRPHFPLARGEIARLPGAFWLVAALSAAFTLARFSEAFLVLKAQAVGVTLALAPMVFVFMNAVYALAAFPAGVIGDGEGGRMRLLLASLPALIAADLALAFADGALATFAGVALWGLHMGLSQGVLAALVADAAPAELRGTGFGIFNLVTGLALLAASVLAGLLWEFSGARATFLAGAGFAALALAGFLALSPRKAKPVP